jgi:hypothetical protein
LTQGRTLHTPEFLGALRQQLNTDEKRRFGGRNYTGIAA